MKLARAAVTSKHRLMYSMEMLYPRLFGQKHPVR